MASKLDVSPPRTRALNPPEPLKSQRSGGRHETLWRSAITLERQISDPNPLAAKVGGSKMDRDPGMVRRVITGRAKR